MMSLGVSLGMHRQHAHVAAFRNAGRPLDRSTESTYTGFMSSIDLAAVEAIVSRERYVAFIDVLGYSDLLKDRRLSDQTRLQYLYDVWEVLIAAFQRLDMWQDRIKYTVFSDCAYLSSKEPNVALAAASLIFSDVFHFYRGHQTTWVPWLRCGIGHGWIMPVFDPSVRGSSTSHTAAFRNPVGPGLVDAVKLENSRDRPGMRILVPRAIYEQYKNTIPRDDVTEWLGASDLLGDWLRAEGSEDILDLPWWRAVGDPTAVSAAVWKEHEWQRTAVGDEEKVLRHYRRTLELIERG